MTLLFLFVLALLQCASAVPESNQVAPSFSQGRSLKELPLYRAGFSPVNEKLLLKEKNYVSHMKNGKTIPSPKSGFSPSPRPSARPTTLPSVPSSVPPVSVPSSSDQTMTPSAKGGTIPPMLKPYLPTHRPTPHPTHSERYIMFVSQTLFGISAADFNGVSVNREAFTGTVAACFSGISSADISITATVDVSSSSNALVSAVAEAFNLRRLQSATITVNYTISYNIASRGFSGDPDGAYHDMLSHLMVATSTDTDDTVFNVNLADNADIFSAVDMEGVTSGPVYSSGYQAGEADDDTATSSGKDEMSKRTKWIIGLAVGIGGFIVLCVMVLVALWCFEKIVCCVLC